MAVFIVWIVGFVGFTAAVAIGTCVIVSRMEKGADAAEEFYSGGHALTWPYIFGSLMLTNLSTESLVGLNGSCWQDGSIAALAWESTAALALILTASVFLPRFYAKGFVTTPALLQEVFGLPVRAFVSLLFMLMYTFILLPANLYSCAVAFQTMFNIEADVDLWLLIAGVTFIGCIYALGGGMKSVAVSDTLNGIGLLIGGVTVPLLGLLQWGDKLWANEERLGVLVPSSNEQHPLLKGIKVSMPWHAVFSGTLLIQVFYWSTNQVIVQRALCAKTFAHGQKGLLLAAVFKMLGPFMLCLVGALALGVNLEELDLGIGEGQADKCLNVPYSQGTECFNDIKDRVDRVYPAIVRLTLPAWSLGVFAAVLLGSALSSFNSGIASASTLFAFEIYPFIKSDATDIQRVTMGRVVGLLIAVISAVAANDIPNWDDGVFNLVRKYKHVFALPILVLFLLGIMSKRPSKVGAWITIAVSMVSYNLLVVFDGADSIVTFAQDTGLNQIHWLHRYLLCVVLGYAVHEVTAYGRGEPVKVEQETNVREVEPWIFNHIASVGIVAVLVLMYVALSFPNAIMIVVLVLSWAALTIFFFIDRSVDTTLMKPAMITELS